MTGVTKAGNEKLAAVDEIGEDVIFDWFAEGMTLKTALGKLNIGYKLWGRWLRQSPGREDRFNEARMIAGDLYAGEAVEIAKATSPETVQADRLTVDTFKWYAGKLNDNYDTRRQDVSVNISLNDLHAQAAELLANTIEGEAKDVE